MAVSTTSLAGSGSSSVQTAADVALATDTVSLSATGFVASNGGLLYSFQVMSGTGLTLTLTDSSGVTGGRVMGTYAGLTAGDLIKFENGVVFTNGLYAALTGTGSLKFEVA